jgi:hypothetical protein
MLPDRSARTEPFARAKDPFTIAEQEEATKDEGDLCFRLQPGCMRVTDLFGGWDSAYAPLRSTEVLSGSIQLKDDKGGVALGNDLHARDPKKKYELFLLALGCPASGIQEHGAQEKLEQAAKGSQKLGSFKGDGKGSLLVKRLSVKAAMSRGILLEADGYPVSCADVAPSSFGPPPALPKK